MRELAGFLRKSNIFNGIFLFSSFSSRPRNEEKKRSRLVSPLTRCDESFVATFLARAKIERDPPPLPFFLFVSPGDVVSARFSV